MPETTTGDVNEVSGNNNMDNNSHNNTDVTSYSLSDYEANLTTTLTKIEPAHWARLVHATIFTTTLALHFPFHLITRCVLISSQELAPWPHPHGS